MIPKPTKTEVVKALTHLRIAEIEDNREKSKARHKNLQAEIEAELIKLAAKIPAKESNVSWSVWSKRVAFIKVEKEIQQEDIPASLNQKILEHHRELENSRRGVDPKLIEKEIRMKMDNRSTTDERVEMILEDKESRKVLTEILKSI